MTGFEGFSPRHTLITRLRNSKVPTLNTSSLFIIIDSKREVDIGLGRYFSQTVLGDGEIMISNAALRHMQINPKKKEKVQLHFSIDTLQAMLGPLAMAGGA